MPRAVSSPIPVRRTDGRFTEQAITAQLLDDGRYLVKAAGIRKVYEAHEFATTYEKAQVH